MLRVAVSVAALVTVYYLLPLHHSSTPEAVTILVIGLAGFIALVAVQVRLIIRSPFPTLRAIEALAISVPLFLLLFAGTYVVLAALSAANFGGHLAHTDGLYFTVTVFSTVGFGDIAAKTETARLVVTGQMIADLIIILGVAIKVIVGAIRRRQQGSAARLAPGPGLVRGTMSRRPNPAAYGAAPMGTATAAASAASAVPGRCKENWPGTGPGMACEVYVSAPPASSMTVHRRTTSTAKVPGGRTREVMLDPGASAATPIRGHLVRFPCCISIFEPSYVGVKGRPGNLYFYPKCKSLEAEHAS